MLLEGSFTLTRLALHLVHPALDILWFRRGKGRDLPFWGEGSAVLWTPSIPCLYDVLA